MNASEILIGVNDEHGLDPPTGGKRTPVMPYLDRSIYENEFNRPAKIYCAIALLRSGLCVYDLHPEVSDVPVQTRVARANRAGVKLLATFAYIAFGSGRTFNAVSGVLNYYSGYSRVPAASRELAEDIYAAIVSRSLQTDGKGVSTLDDVGVLRSVNCPSALIEAGFMTNLREARLMLDPDWRKSIGYAAAIGICDYADISYVDEGNPASYPAVAPGNRNSYVEIAQYYLTLCGFPVKADGIFGSDTESAVKAFQNMNGLEPDGIIGRQTWTKLVLPSPSAYILRTGSTGSAVSYLQLKLLSKLYPLAADGIFGEETENALKLFQTESGLEPDGIAGPLTFSVLGTLSSPRDE